MRSATGKTLMVAALGAMLGLLGIEIQEFETWASALTPEFVGKSFMHFATVIAAYVSGQLIPTAQVLKRQAPPQ